MSMKKIIILFVVLVLLASPVLADYTKEEVRNEVYSFYHKDYSTTSASSGTQYWTTYVFNDIDQYSSDLILIKHVYEANKISMSSIGTYPFVMSKSGVTYGTGTLSIFSLSATQLVSQLQFDTFDRGALTNTQIMTMTYTGGSPPSGGGMSRRQTTSDVMASGFYISGQGFFPFLEYDAYFVTLDKADVYSQETETYASSYVNRVVDGMAFTSTVTYTRGDGLIVASSYDDYNTSVVYMADEYTTLSIVFDTGYTWTKTYNPTGNYTPITPTPTPTVSVSNSGCGMNIELSLSKYANIFPYENITASLSIDDTSNLTSGSKITYVIFEPLVKLLVSSIDREAVIFSYGNILAYFDNDNSIFIPHPEFETETVGVGVGVIGV